VHNAVERAAGLCNPSARFLVSQVPHYGLVLTDANRFQGLAKSSFIPSVDYQDSTARGESGCHRASKS